MKHRVLALVDEAYEDLELWYPAYRLMAAGADVTFVGHERGHTYTGKHGVPVVSDRSFKEALQEAWDMLLVPGGWAPDKLRRDPDVLTIVRKMDELKKPIGMICHAGWVLISAKILNGRKVTSTPGIRDDIENAGATWLDAPVVVDGHIISARRPPDLPAYGEALVQALQKV